MVTITSTDNPRVKALAKLKTARERRRSGLFLIEGSREVGRALQAGVIPITVVSCPELGGSALQLPDTVEQLTVSAAPMSKIAVRQNPPGVIAVARQFSTALETLDSGPSPLILIAEHVEKPGNLGAMMRTCDAVGADALVVVDPATDVFNPNVVRASQGALFSVPIAVTSTEEMISWCERQSIQVIGGYPDAETDMWTVDLTDAVAILVGAEDTGITSAWSAVATPVRIPLAGAADSLNASVAAAVLLYEAARRRRS